jgi:intein/homing endonuclease
MIKADSPTINTYRDLHEQDGYTYWDKGPAINRRKLSTIYLPKATKRLLVNSINTFFSSREFYKKHGVPWNLKILLEGPAGPQPDSIEIPTPTGMKRFGDIKPGDYVFSINGLPTLVEEVYEYGELPVYEIEFSDGRKVLCSPTHKWPTITSKGNIIEKSVEELLDSGILYESDVPKYKIPLGWEARFSYQHIPMDPWVVGVLIGNGNLRQKNRLTLSSPDSIIPRYVAFDLGFDFKRRSDDDNDFNWCFYHKDGSPVIPEDFLKDIPELIDSYSRDKVIPDAYMFNTRDNRYALLQGLMDTDGSITETDATIGEYKRYSISFSTTSKVLAEQVVFLVNSLGFSATISLDSGYRATVLIQCNDIDKHLFFRRSPKIDIAYRSIWGNHNRKNESNPVLSIISIKDLGYQEKMRCLHVQDRLHLYLTTGFIPTCNSGKDSIARMIASEYNRNIYYVTGGKSGKFIPQAITSYGEDIISPLYLISDIDKYPFIINESDINLDEDKAKEEQMMYKQSFGQMINALDGAMSGEGKIIVMTTNHIEKFSPTFLRAGRIDLNLHIGYVTPEVFRKYVYDFYNVVLPEDIQLKSDKLTVADMQFKVMFLKVTVEEFIQEFVK